MGERENKGKDYTKYTSNYCVLDLETTGRNVLSDKIIEISAIRVRDGKVVATYSTLVNPQKHIPRDATLINHITDDMVKDAPVLSDVIDDFMDFVGNDVIVGYNNKAFDMNILYDAYEELRGAYFDNDFIDVLFSSRRCLDFLDSHTLKSVSEYFELDTTGEHRALKDCYLTKDVYEKLYEKYGDKAFYRDPINEEPRRPRFSESTMALQELQEYLSEILRTGDVSLSSVIFLQNWMSSHEDLKDTFPFNTIYTTLERIIENGFISAEEKYELKELFKKTVDPVNNAEEEEIKGIRGKHIVVTGDFECGSREEVFSMIEKAGGIVDKNTKKSTDYVVVGSYGSDNWKTQNYGAKVQKAMQFNEKGCDIKIIKEEVFLQMLLAKEEEEEVREEVQEEADATMQQELSDNIETPEEPNLYEGDKTWQERITDLLNDIVKEYELPENSLYLKANYSKANPSVITSYSVAVWEPDYPLKSRVIVSKNASAFNIIEKKDKLRLVVDLTQFEDIKPPKYAEIKRIKSDMNNVRVTFNKNSNELLDFTRAHMHYTLARYESKADSFGCCSRFEQCSDAKKCIHENKLYSKACMYRKNLEAGRIFYGKNKNVTVHIDLEEQESEKELKPLKRQVTAKYITRAEYERRKAEALREKQAKEAEIIYDTDDDLSDLPLSDSVTTSEIVQEKISSDDSDTYKVKVEKEEELFVFDTKTVFSGAEKPDGDDRVMRKALGLPVTKQLIYYDDPRDSDTVINILGYRVVKLYEITDRWATMEIELENEEKRLINSLYLVEMQKTSFIEEIRAQEV